MKNFTEKEIIQLKEYLSSIIGNPTPFSKQKSVFGPDKFCQWCEEWELIEMLKYLINGKNNYFLDPPPNRLKKSTLWSKEKIEERVLKDLGDLESVEQIINYFKKERESFHEGT